MYLQSNDGGEGSDHGVLQYTQLAPEQQYSAREKDLSISTLHPNSIGFSPTPQIKTTMTNDAIFIFNSFNLVTLNGNWGRTWMVANNLNTILKIIGQLHLLKDPLS